MEAARRGAEAGATIVETIVAMALGLLAGATAVALLRVQVAVARAVQSEIGAVSAASWALDVALRDVELAGADPLRTGLPGLRAASDGAIEIEADLDGDGAVDAGSAERRSIYWSAGSGGRVLRRLGGQSTALAAPVPSSGLRIRLLDGDGTALGPGALDPAELARARRVELEVAVAGTTGRPLPEVRLSSVGAIRARFARRVEP